MPQDGYLRLLTQEELISFACVCYYNRSANKRTRFYNDNCLSHLQVMCISASSGRSQSQPLDTVMPNKKLRDLLNSVCVKCVCVYVCGITIRHLHLLVISEMLAIWLVVGKHCLLFRLVNKFFI